ncbi:ABC transporter ATPase [Mycoplasmopsis gallopavonis]|uniref:ABC transporter ATPase n=1 Tax=Mycoplasmopsis gallopavonis TaxID=76629 RepID=A0A449AZI0_9BACT|nr:ABC transporter ATP-binding protein [Mycoplasmopsis gallopavonis]VEU72894.1 ABC transporter ATPase [Mycoplasmopsis gallopavonis]
MLQVKNLSKKYGKKQVFNNLNFEIKEKTITFIISPSGQGKSTLLNILGGVDKEFDGLVEYQHKDQTLSPNEMLKQNFVDFIFQDFNLFEDLKIKENLSFPLNFINHQFDKNGIDPILKKLNLDNLDKNEKVKNLSGGEKQRIAIARSLTRDSQIILADEPTGNLDAQNSQNIFEILSDLSLSKTIIVVSHDLKAAEKYGDYIYDLANNKMIQNNPSYLKKDIWQPNKNSRKKISFAKYKPLWTFSWKEIKRKWISFILMIFLIGFSSSLLSNTFNLHNNSAVVSQKYFEQTDSDYIEVSNKVGDNHSRQLLNLEKTEFIKNKFQKEAATQYFSYKINQNIFGFSESDSSFLIQFKEINDSPFWKNKLAKMDLMGRLPLTINEVLISNETADKYGFNLENNNLIRTETVGDLRIVGIFKKSNLNILSSKSNSKHQNVEVLTNNQTTKKISSDFAKKITLFQLTLFNYDYEISQGVSIKTFYNIKIDNNLADNEFSIVNFNSQSLHKGSKYKLEMRFVLSLDLNLKNIDVSNESNLEEIRVNQKTYDKLLDSYNKFINGYPSGFLMYFNNIESLEKTLSSLTEITKKESHLDIYTNFASLNSIIIGNSRDTTKLILIFAFAVLLISLISIFIFSYLIIQSKTKEIALLKLLGLNSLESLIYHLSAFFIVAVISFGIAFALMYPIYLTFTLLIKNLYLLRFDWALSSLSLFIFWISITGVSFLVFFIVSIKKFYASTNKLLKEK